MIGVLRNSAFTLFAACTALSTDPALAHTLENQATQDRLEYSSAFEVTAGEEAAIDRIVADIGDRRIVALGEISHGDGSSFLFKARLIERLHREHGFDVLAMEGGIYDHAVAEDRIKAGEQSSQAFARANFAIWSQSAEFGPVLEAVDLAAKAGRPFALTGFDFQLSGNYRDEIMQRFTAMADRLGEEGNSIRFLMGAYASLHRARMGTQSAFDEAIDKIDSNRQAALTAIRQSDWQTAQADARMIDNFARLIRFNALYSRLGFEGMGSDEFNVRDQMMGGNLNVLATDVYPGRKFVIWAASAHAIKSRTPIDDTVPMIPMGYYIDNGPVSDEYYVLGFSAFEGVNGSYSGETWELEMADPDGIETYAMEQSGQAKTAFVELPECGEAIAKIRALGHKYYTGDWGCAIDGLVVFREMLPATYPNK